MFKQLFCLPTLAAMAATMLAGLASFSAPANARALLNSNNFSSTTYAELKSCLRSADSMPKLDLQKLQGVWYTDTANQANELVSCAMTRYDAIESDENRLFVTKFVQFRNGERQLLKPTVGWRMPSTDALVMLHEGPTPQDSVALMTFIVDTDYDNYVVIYTCGLLGAGDVIRTAHIMTRAVDVLDREKRDAIVEYTFGNLGDDSTLHQRPIGKEACPMIALSPLGRMAK